MPQTAPDSARLGESPRNALIPIASRLYHLSRVGGRSETREVGIILGVTPTGHLTARAPGGTFAPEGTRVQDHSGRVSGRIVRVFGPVERPYLSVRLKRPPRPEQGLELLGAPLIRE